MLNNIKTQYTILKRELFDIYYSSLNDMQREAVYTINSPLLILAGAGSGKTTVLVNRITYIIKYGNAYYTDFCPEDIDDKVIEELKNAKKLSHDELGEYLRRFSVSPPPAWGILAITFTNKAANEIKTRLLSSINDEGSAASDIWSGTFHSICMRILRKYGDKTGYSKDCGICDSDDSKKLIADCMKKLNIDTKQLAVKSVINAISRAKDSLLTASDYETQVGNDFKKQQISKIYKMYEARLKESNLLDFDDIIMQTVFLLQNDADVRTALQNRFKYVSVDEFQDTNVAQLELTLLLSGGYHNLMVVGDDDQSIYKFRGATIENILSFDRKLDNVKTIKLEQNYRSTKTILDAANSVIDRNENRHRKNLWTDGDKGEKIDLIKLPTQLDEARYISDTILNSIRDDGLSYTDFAVLYRTNAQSRAIEQSLAKSGIPYRLLGGMKFFDRAEVKDLLAYLSVINNPFDAVRLRRIVNVPKRGIGASSIAKAEMMASSLGISLLEFMRNAGQYKIIPASAAKSMSEFVALIDKLRNIAAEGAVSKVIEQIAELTGYNKMLQEAGEEALDKIDNIGELVSTAIQYEEGTEISSISEFLEDVALVSDVDKYDESADAVVLMTIHSAKGLEFPTVFLPGMEEGLFPGYQSSYDPSETEEERRLMYVALTRAKSKVIITHVHERMHNGSTQYNPPSRFIDEIPSCYISSSDLYGSSHSKKYYSFDDQGNIISTSYNNISTKNTIGSNSYIKSGANSSKVKTHNTKANPLPVFEAGVRVRHATFGTGEVLSVKAMGGDTLYEVNFDKVGVKKLMASFARLKAE